jgi:hypothetical protein
MKKHIFLLLTAISLLTTSCATLFTGTKDTIKFNSTPAGATIYKNGVEQCKTPCELRVNRSIMDTYIDYKLDGYETQLITLDKEFNIIAILNFVNLFGWFIDAASGAVLQYDTKEYNITLTEKDKAAMANPMRIDFDTEKNTVKIYVQAK